MSKYTTGEATFAAALGIIALALGIGVAANLNPVLGSIICFIGGIFFAIILVGDMNDANEVEHER
jgi:hypothetical protein